MELSDIIAVLSLGVSLTSLGVAFLIAKFFGERWVEMARRRREHSLKLNEGVLKPWLSKVEEYCKIEAMYSHNADKMMGVEPKNPTDLEFFDVAIKHLELNYLDIVKAWEELRRVTSELNKELANILEEIRTLTIKEFELPCYYWFSGAEMPEEHIKPDKIAQSIYQEIEWRAPRKRKWVGGAPHVEPVIVSGETFYRLQWGNNTLIRSRDEKKAESSMPLINQLIETSKFKEEIKSLTKRKDEIYKMKRGDFEVKIREVIKSIELGNLLKGKCRYCP